MVGTLLSWIIVLAGGLYLLGVRRRRWPAWRTGAFFAGLAAYAASAIWSPLDAYAAQLFSVHMAQHMLITVVGAPLIVMGAPFLPVLRGLPRGLVRGLRPVLASRALRAAVRFVRQPLVAGAVFIVGLYAWHIPALYDAAVTDELVHDVQHAWFAASSVIFWSVVIDPVPFRATLPPAARIVYLLLAGAAQNTILGGLLTFSSRLLYSSYETSPLRFGIDPVTDQRLGGAIMWVPGDLIFLGAASAAFFQWLAAEERDQLAVEDRQRAAAARRASDRRSGP